MQVSLVELRGNEADDPSKISQIKIVEVLSASLKSLNIFHRDQHIMSYLTDAATACAEQLPCLGRVHVCLDCGVISRELLRQAFQGIEVEVR